MVGTVGRARAPRTVNGLPPLVTSFARSLSELRDAVVDLVLPASCAGCGAGGTAVLCPACSRRLRSASPRQTTPSPAPIQFPPTWALCEYDGIIRRAILEYKERGRRAVAGQLGERLAAVVDAATTSVPSVAPVVLVPIPGTAAAIRRRDGDHVVALAKRAGRALRSSGRAIAVTSPLRARPRRDSAELGASARAVAARGAFAVRPSVAARVRSAVLRGAVVVLVDDIVTTGSTLAAAAATLRAAGVEARAAAVLAATRRRGSRRRAEGV